MALTLFDRDGNPGATVVVTSGGDVRRLAAGSGSSVAPGTGDDVWVGSSVSQRFVHYLAGGTRGDAVTLPPGWGLLRGTVAGLLLIGDNGTVALWHPGGRPVRLARPGGAVTAHSATFLAYQRPGCALRACTVDVVDLHTRRTRAVTFHQGFVAEADLDSAGRLALTIQSPDQQRALYVSLPGRPLVRVATMDPGPVASSSARWVGGGRLAVATTYVESVDVLLWDAATDALTRAGVYDGLVVADFVAWATGPPAP
jgi:hypothetical protein